MASAINYNTVWTSIFEPVSTFSFLERYGRISEAAKRHDLPYHIVGSDLSGVVLRTGPGVHRWKPGQEVVARSQYLGKLKRRLYLGYGEGLPPAAAADVDPLDAPAGPIGHVVQSAPLALPGRFVVQFECRTDGMPTPGPDVSRTPAGAVVRIGGAAIMLLPLPYRIVDAAPADAA